MSNPTMADLRLAYYGGGTDAEFAWLLEAYAQGVNAYDIIDIVVNGSGGGGGEPGVGLDAEQVRDLMGVTLIGSDLIHVVPNDVLDKIEFTTDATQNDTDDSLKARANHTGEQAISTVTGLQPALDAAVQRINHLGTQPSSTISDLVEVIQDTVAALLQEGTNVTLLYNDETGQLSITAAGGSGGGGLDAEGVRDTIGIALIGSGLVSVVANDAGDTITISTTATQNDTDANLKNRANHTGTQDISTVLNLQAALDSKETPAGAQTKADAAALIAHDAAVQRVNHTGTQLSGTISDLAEAVQDLVAAMILQGTNITTVYNDATGALTIASSVGGLVDSILIEELIQRNSTTSITFDFNGDPVEHIDLVGNMTTITFSGAPSLNTAKSKMIVLKQDATGGRGIIWPSTVLWPGGTDFVPSVPGNAIDIITIVAVNSGGTVRYYGFEGGKAFA